jgi:hypothetical protein
MDTSFLVPIREGVLRDLKALTSSTIRKANSSIAEKLICVYKIGLILEPGEVLNWCKKIKKLTSVKHRSILLRVIHGDIYSNSRLHRFGLIQDPKCLNCSAPAETIEHKILHCPKSTRLWNILNVKRASIGLDNIDLTIEGILGINDACLLNLTLNAETLKRIISMGGKPFCPENLAENIIKTIKLNDKMGTILNGIRD